MNGSHLTPLEALERFVVENDDLLALEERVGRFNIFDALRVARVEIRHSNFLAWLLDPAESHGQGDLFLKATLMDLLREAPRELRPLSPVELDGVELRGVEVHREWHNVDLLVVCQDPPFVVAVENKVGGREGPGQLKRYEEAVAGGLPGVPALHVFLTVNGDEASRPGWYPYTYEDIYRALDRCRRTSAGAIGDDVAVALNHYLRLLGSRFMDDPNIDELCRRIYKTHRQALDLIYEKAGVGQSGLSGAIATWVQQSDEYDLVRANPARVTFTPRNWIGVLPPIAKNKHHLTQWLLCEVEFEQRRCRFLFRAWPCTDVSQRLLAIERVIADPKEFGLKPSYRKIPPKWTQLFSEPILRWKKEEDPDPDEAVASLEKLLAKHIDRLSTAVHAAADALQEARDEA